MTTSFGKIAAIFLIFAFLVSACQKKESQNAMRETEDFESVKNGLREMGDEERESLFGKKIAVILGYGFNDEETVLSVSKMLDDEFGLCKKSADDVRENDGGMIKILVFPDDFMKGSKPRVSMLSSLLEDDSLLGIVTLGAPDGLHKEIALMADNENFEKIPVISLFSQDDVLAAEEAADFVIDFDHGADSLSNENLNAENEIEHPILDSIPHFNLEETLVKIVQFEIKDGKTAPTIEKVSEILGNRSVRAYLDSATKIQSINHFTFE